MKRKPIQIAASQDESSASLYALCDDGSVWEMVWANTTNPPWQRLADIPQEPELVRCSAPVAPEPDLREITPPRPRRGRPRGRKNFQPEPRPVGLADSRVLEQIVSAPGIDRHRLVVKLKSRMPPNILGTCVMRLLNLGMISGDRWGPYTVTEAGTAARQMTKAAKEAT